MEPQQTNQSPSPVFDTARFRQIYKNFNTDTLRDLSTIYSPGVIFKDPVHQINGLAELSNYFAGLCDPEMQCEFEITNEIATSNQAFFQWKMRYRHPRLKAGQPLILDGGTLIKFNTQIVYHEDFYDMGAMIYQHVPLLGWAVKKINARIAGANS